ncbi:MAG: hypothetical protein BWY74_02485 [Firmicutes bacterium ADurb.Bin419]|nr:MAG: hypothetical protein BWY74_02485 [Firmicutes bacterium ADurb.Bin419]
MIDSYLFCIYWKDYHVIWRIYIELIHRYENIDEICSSTHTILDVLTIYVVAGVIGKMRQGRRILRRVLKNNLSYKRVVGMDYDYLFQD